MFKIGDESNIIYGGKYSMDSYTSICNSTFDGSFQVFLEKNSRSIFIDCNIDTKQCYSVAIIIGAFKYHNIEYNLPKCKKHRLFYERSDYENIGIYNDFNVKCYVDMKNKLILIGDPSTLIKPICFFDNTFAVIDNNKLKLLILQLDENIIEKIKANKLVI